MIEKLQETPRGHGGCTGSSRGPAPLETGFSSRRSARRTGGGGLRSAIPGAVVDHDDLDIRVVLTQRGIDRFAREIALVEDREADGDERL